MLKLYELPEAFRAIEAEIQANDGELPPDLEERLDALEGNLEDKADAIAALIRDAEVESIAVKVELDRLTVKRQHLTGKAERLKSYLHDQLVMMGRPNVKGARFAVRVQKNGQPAIRWTGLVDEIPDEFRRVEVSLNGHAARDFYKATGSLPDGFEVTYGTHLRIS